MIWQDFEVVSSGSTTCTLRQCTYGKVGVTLEDLNGCCLGAIKNIPVVDSGICDKAKRGLGDPLPEHDVFVHSGRLQLRLVVEIEYLERSRLCLEGNDVARPVHDGTVGLDGAPCDIVVVLEIDDNDFG